MGGRRLQFRDVLAVESTAECHSQCRHWKFCVCQCRCLRCEHQGLFSARHPKTFSISTSTTSCTTTKGVCDIACALFQTCWHSSSWCSQVKDPYLLFVTDVTFVPLPPQTDVL